MKSPAKFTKCYSTWMPFGTVMLLQLLTKRIKSSTMDVRLEFEFKENDNRPAVYCLIIHDRVIEYSSMSNVICKVT